MSQCVQERVYEAPPTRSMLLEMTALAEIPLFLSSSWLLRRLLPRGDGHPVLVMPGFMAADGATASLRRQLARLDYDPYPWNLGANPGICQNVNLRVQDRVQEIASATGQKVSLIGWSAGGIYARVAAHQQTESVRQVITLGAPFGIDYRFDIGGAVGRLYSRTRQALDSAPLIESGHIVKPPPVPSTSILSKRDGLAFWKFSLDVSDHNTENIFVPGSHTGMTHNIFILSLLADRLSQKEGHWRPFSPSASNRALFRPVCATQKIPQSVKSLPG